MAVNNWELSYQLFTVISIQAHVFFDTTPNEQIVFSRLLSSKSVVSNTGVNSRFFMLKSFFILIAIPHFVRFVQGEAEHIPICAGCYNVEVIM
jgi:hypothetical protein